ncbi:MAG: hypothetical protein GYA61_04135 [Spirochaetales bacterium]|nr:hypothetical protein [Spirochaetales bacterium]
MEPELSEFTDGNIEFKYPSVFKEKSSPTREIISGSSDWQDLGTLSLNDQILIEIVKAKKETTPIEARDVTEESRKALTHSELLSHTTIKNSHNILAYSSIHSVMDPRTREMITYNIFFFKAKGKVYALTVLGYDYDFEIIELTADIIFETLQRR